MEFPRRIACCPSPLRRATHKKLGSNFKILIENEVRSHEKSCHCKKSTYEILIENENHPRSALKDAIRGRAQGCCRQSLQAPIPQARLAVDMGGPVWRARKEG